jgi:hypothetical protein
MSAMPLEGLGEAAAVARRTIPFDVAFRYTLSGERDRVHRSTVTISIEATFVAVSIGYGVVPAVDLQTFGPQLANLIFLLRSGVVASAAELRAGLGTTRLRDIPLGALLDGLANVLDERLPGGQIGTKTAAVFANGFKLNGAFASHLLADGANAALDSGALSRLFQVVAAPADQVQFRYALFDDATGREFQSQPILNIAGLGTANGERPFRHFARPIAFAPRSTVRLEVIEQSEFQGELHLALQGYKVLGAAGSPTGRPVSPRLSSAARRRLRPRGRP